METTIAIALVKANVAIVLFYAFYKVFFGRDTFFSWRRWVLLGSYGVALLLPFLSIDAIVSNHAATVKMAHDYAEVVLPAVTISAQPQSVSLAQVLWLVYLVGVALLGVRLLVQVLSLMRLAASTPVVNLQGSEVHIVERGDMAFSFFSWIFLRVEGQSEEAITEMLAHERTHVEQYHSFDALLSELFCVAFWFNPFCWLMRREVRINLEYLADESVVGQVEDSRDYQYRLLHTACEGSPAAFQLANQWHFSPLKKRIRTMNSARTPQVQRTKYLLLVPLVLGLLVLSGVESLARELPKVGKTQEVSIAKPSAPNRTRQAPSVARVAPADVQQPVEKQPTEVKKPSSSQDVQQEEDSTEHVYYVSETMPSYPGGPAALMKYLSETVKYPAAAYKNKIEGRVIVSFIVKRDGQLSNAEVVRSVSPELDAEALRVVKGMPKWIPGKQDGKPVNVRYTVPLTFRIQ
jgi:TonB family protein